VNDVVVDNIVAVTVGEEVGEVVLISIGELMGVVSFTLEVTFELVKDKSLLADPEKIR